MISPQHPHQTVIIEDAMAYLIMTVKKHQRLIYYNNKHSTHFSKYFSELFTLHFLKLRYITFNIWTTSVLSLSKWHSVHVEHLLPIFYILQNTYLWNSKLRLSFQESFWDHVASYWSDFGSKLYSLCYLLSLF